MHGALLDAWNAWQVGGGEDAELKAKAWRWRELVTRIASGAAASADISTAWWAGAEDLPGPNFPCPIGFQVNTLLSCSASAVQFLRSFLGSRGRADPVAWKGNQGLRRTTKRLEVWLLVCCLVQGLAERLAEGLDIRYGAVVTSVAWGPHGVSVTCSDGSVHSADAVIMTVSLAVLKAC